MNTTTNFITNLPNFETITIKKIRAFCELEDFSKKDVDASIAELGLGGGGSTWKTDFYAALSANAMSESEFEAILEEGSKNVKNHAGAHRAVWELAQAIRNDLG